MMGTPAGLAPARDAHHFARLPLTRAVERIVPLGTDGARVGILTEGRPGVVPGAAILITAGMVHRVGPNGLYVTLARRLASQGITALRFDLSGIGDSPHRTDGLPADESATIEVREAMDAVQASSGATSFVLAGLCSGAVTAFRTALADTRVAGALLLNPQGFHHDPAWNAYVNARAEARRYVKKSLRDGEKWRRALGGRIDYRRLGRVLKRRAFGAPQSGSVVPAIAHELAGELAGLTRRGTRVLVVCSEGDSSIDYMSTILGTDAARGVDREGLRLRVFAQTDHSLTLASRQQALFALMDEWLGEWPR